MDYNTVSAETNKLTITGLKHFLLDEILDNGQAFRWQKRTDEEPSTTYEGIAFEKQVEFCQTQDTLTIVPATMKDWEEIWCPYFDLATDYSQIKSLFITDPILNSAIEYAPGVRILRQDPWETLATFILSQNNNIKRIKGIVERLCSAFGNPVGTGYGFPPAERIAELTLEELAPIRAGFRAKYLLDAAQKVACGTVNLPALYTLPLPEAQQELEQIYGVGAKVAHCVLLFGFHRLECFPKDVWIKRCLAGFYPKGFPKKLEPWGGIAQQYLFYYFRANEHLLQEQELKKGPKTK